MATTPRPAAKKPVDLDLDTLELEGDKPPMTIRVAGTVITLRDFRDLDWQIAFSLSPDRPYQFFEEVIPEADQEAFLKARFPYRKMIHLMSQYEDYYELPKNDGSEQDARRRGNSRG